MLCVAIVALLAVLPAWTPAIEGVDAVSSLEPVRIGGVEQWLLIRGHDRSKPVLLFLHGGPGAGAIYGSRPFRTPLEEHFVVVHWDQRGAGKSCTDEVPDESLRLERYVSDTLELVRLLQERFAKERVYVIGHSWGSVLGVLAVQREPDLFGAYVGLGQVVDMRRGEDISYRWVVEQAEAERNDEALEQLARIRPPYGKLEQLILQRSWLGHYGGDVHAGDMLPRLVRALLTAPEYTLAEKASFYGCFLNSVREAWFDLEEIDFIESVPRLDVPVYFFTGRHDYNTPSALVAEWASVLQAPHVEVVWFDESAHMPNIEEPERFQRELIDRFAVARGPDG